MKPNMVTLGTGGYIGRNTVQTAFDAGWRALVQVAACVRHGAAPVSYAVADGAQTTQHAFLHRAATLVGASPPGRLPAWLAGCSVLVHKLTADLQSDASDLLQTGFRFSHSSYLESMRPTLQALGHRIASATGARYA